MQVLLLGDSEVGKTCLLERLTKGEAASMATKATVGVEFGTKTLSIDRKTCRVQIWDTAGQERYRSIAANYYRGAQGVLIMYDITRMESMDHVRDWMSSLKQHVTDCAIVMLGNKDDLAESRVSVPMASIAANA
jgi:small GTP-binding protein